MPSVAIPFHALVTKVDNEFPVLSTQFPPPQSNITKITAQVKSKLMTELHDIHVTYKRCDLERDWIVDIYALRLLNTIKNKAGLCKKER